MGDPLEIFVSGAGEVIFKKYSPIGEPVSYTHLDGYKRQLMAERGKSEAPTLFQVNGPVGLANWKAVSYTHLDVYKRQM